MALGWLPDVTNLMVNLLHIVDIYKPYSKSGLIFPYQFPNGNLNFGSLCREEFTEMFGVAQQKYQKLREELDCEKAFPHVYEKISKLGRS